jgi:hypothetical protein
MTLAGIPARSVWAGASPKDSFGQSLTRLVMSIRQLAERNLTFKYPFQYFVQAGSLARGPCAKLCPNRVSRKRTVSS